VSLFKGSDKWGYEGRSAQRLVRIVERIIFVPPMSIIATAEDDQSEPRDTTDVMVRS
jgi:hypothetical protein